MNPWLVEWTLSAEDETAEIWIQAPDPKAVTKALALIEKRLAQNPEGAGEYKSEGLYVLLVPPIRIYYTIEVVRRRVEVTDVRYAP